jgi:hypothetical protein
MCLISGALFLFKTLNARERHLFDRSDRDLLQLLAHRDMRDVPNMPSTRTTKLLVLSQLISPEVVAKGLCFRYNQYG